MTFGEIYKSSLIDNDVGLNKEQESSVFLLSLSLFLSEVIILKDGNVVETENLTIEELSCVNIPNSYIRDFSMCTELYITSVSNKNLGIIKNLGVNQEIIPIELQEEAIRAILKKRHNMKEPTVIFTEY